MKNTFSLFAFTLGLTWAIVHSGNCEAVRLNDSLQITPIKVLNEDWLIYNKKYSSFVPLFKSSKINTNTISQWIYAEQFRNYTLSFTALPYTSLFVNNKLIYQSGRNKEFVTFDINQLTRQYGSKLFVSFYNHRGNLPYNDVFVGFDRKKSPASRLPQVKSRSNYLAFRTHSDIQKYYVSVFLMIALLVAIVKTQFPKIYQDFIGFKNILSSSLQEDISLLRLFSVPVLLMILLNAVLLSFIIQTYFQGYLFSAKTYQNHGFSYTGFFINSTIIMLLFIVKYYVLKILGWLMNFSELVKIQYYEYLKLTLKISILLAIVIFLAKVTGFVEGLEFTTFVKATLVIFLIFLLLRSIYLATKIAPFRNVYLFSYLCTSEILPTIIMVKLILNQS